MQHHIHSISPAVVEACFKDFFIAMAQSKGSSHGVLDWKPNSWTYNFVEVSGHNLESSHT